VLDALSDAFERLADAAAEGDGEGPADDAGRTGHAH